MNKVPQKLYVLCILMRDARLILEQGMLEHNFLITTVAGATTIL
jgi:hypothetical protein